LLTAVDFVRAQYGIDLPQHRVSCAFSDKNKQCIGSACPFFGE
jgi:hypothetical protein